MRQDDLPPVRGMTKVPAAAPAVATGSTTATAEQPAAAPTKIKGSDYRSWDKFVVRGPGALTCARAWGGGK